MLTRSRMGARYLFLYRCGAPTSGASAAFPEAALPATREGLRVLIVCPTGRLVHAFKAQLTDVGGVKHIHM